MVHNTLYLAKSVAGSILKSFINLLISPKKRIERERDAETECVCVCVSADKKKIERNKQHFNPKPTSSPKKFSHFSVLCMCKIDCV